MSKSNYHTLYQFFLKRGQYEKIDQEWATDNKDIIRDAGYAAQMHFFPKLTALEDWQADQDLAHLNATCGRGIE